MLKFEAWAFQPLAKQKRPIQKEAVQNLGHLDLTKKKIYKIGELSYWGKKTKTNIIKHLDPWPNSHLVPKKGGKKKKEKFDQKKEKRKIVFCYIRATLLSSLGSLLNVAPPLLLSISTNLQFSYKLLY